MKNIFPLALAATLCAAPAVVQACSCLAPPAPKIALEKSDAVFIGKASLVKSAGYSNTFQFAVTKKWKGVEGDTVSVVSATDSAACGINFDTDREYLVYANKNGDSAQLSTNLCSRTKRLSDAAADLAALGEPAVATTNTGAASDATDYPTKNGIVQINAEVTRDPLKMMVEALQTDKSARQFRVNWSAPTAYPFNGTALYNRAANTLKVYSRSQIATEIRVESVLYSGVTDQVLTQLADTDEVEEFFANYARYGVSRRDLGSKTVRVTQ